VRWVHKKGPWYLNEHTGNKKPAKKTQAGLFCTAPNLAPPSSGPKSA